MSRQERKEVWLFMKMIVLPMLLQLLALLYIIFA